ncbi:hypothetical protein ACFQO1_00450 [Jejudonia soesokkakensis]|uniref:Uncharacterized protein n=1 Tax=Jejudonia soesokkakensis TaxID=1323432 RepID=A0ABW2MR16_9FLAO
MIEHPYIFENEKYKLDSLTYLHQNDSMFVSANFTGDTGRINKNCVFYFQLFVENNNSDFEYIELPLQMLDKNSFQFSEKVHFNKKKYKEFRFGIADKKIKKRHFTISLKDFSFN